MCCFFQRAASLEVKGDRLALDGTTQRGDALLSVGLFASVLVCVTLGDIGLGSI